MKEIWHFYKVISIKRRSQAIFRHSRLFKTPISSFLFTWWCQSPSWKIFRSSRLSENSPALATAWDRLGPWSTRTLGTSCTSMWCICSTAGQSLEQTSRISGPRKCVSHRCNCPAYPLPQGKPFPFSKCRQAIEINEKFHPTMKGLFMSSIWSMLHSYFGP